MLTFEDLKNKTRTIAIVGLGYVGLPLACAFAKHFKVTGFDVKASRIKELLANQDKTNEVEAKTLASVEINFTSDPESLKEAGLIIVAVPTPIDSHRNPDLTPVIKATQTVGQNLSPNTIICYESTVYPGVTEEVCLPILLKESHLTFGQDFQLGYSPERINPGHCGVRIYLFQAPQ